LLWFVAPPDSVSLQKNLSETPFFSSVAEIELLRGFARKKLFAPPYFPLYSAAPRFRRVRSFARLERIFLSPGF
jgi:hypothetical protein